MDLTQKIPKTGIPSDIIFAMSLQYSFLIRQAFYVNYVN